MSITDSIYCPNPKDTKFLSILWFNFIGLVWFKYPYTICQKGESQNGCLKKTKHVKFSGNTRFEIRPSALLSAMFQLPLNLSFKACKNFLEKISISFSIFLQMHTFFYSFFSTNVLIIADENTHAFDGILFFSLILCFFQSSSIIFF